MVCLFLCVRVCDRHEDCELIKRNYLQEREKLESIVSTIAHVENDMKVN